MDVAQPSILVAKVMHVRTMPAHNQFTYSVYYLSFALRHMARLGCTVLSLNRFNLFSYYARDHGAPATENEPWIRGVLHDYNLSDTADGDVVLVTMPRILGYAFNPVSFWFCLDAQQQVRAVLSEVNNTFGETHCYISYHDDKRVIASDDWMESEKIFHVSPFLAIEGHYHYRFLLEADRIGVWINHETDAGVMLRTAVTGKRIALTSRNLLWCFMCTPLLTFKVTGLIYWQALKLVLKKVPYNRKPNPPTQDITR